MKNKLKLILPAIVILPLLGLGNLALASEVTGTLSTGLNSTVGNTVNGVVIAPPVASPVAGAYTSAQSVALSAPGASSIHYTIDGTAPTCSTGTVYSSAISVNSSMVIEAISCYSNGQSSTVASYLYAINIPATTSTSSGGGGGGGGGGYSGSVTTTSSVTLSAAAQKVDANKDNKVDVLDFVSLMANWGKTGSSIVADFNGDSKVDVFDFVLLMVNWTK